jgi:biotin synthase
MNWNALAEKSLVGELLNSEDCSSVLDCRPEKLLDLVSATARVRFQYFGRRVKLNYLMNVKSGICPEDCGYCSQSKISNAPIDRYPFLSPQEIAKGAQRARSLGAVRLCLVASGRGPTEREIQGLCDAIRQVKASDPSLEICACLGLLADGNANQLREAGVYAYNHNLNASERFYPSICSTHTYQDRIQTVGRAKSSGLSACSGGIVGMGETDADIVALAIALRELRVESIPVNFLTSIDGTPMAGTHLLDARRCLKILCLFRLLNPTSELRIAGGREIHLGSLQPLGLYVANSIFIGDYLTTRGQLPQEDWRMIQELGFEIEGDFVPPRDSSSRSFDHSTPGSLIQGARV